MEVYVVNYLATSGRGIVPVAPGRHETIGEFTFAPWRLGATHDCKRFSLDAENFMQRTFPLRNLIRSVGKVLQTVSPHGGVPYQYCSTIVLRKELRFPPRHK